MIIRIIKNIADVKTPTNLAKSPRHIWNTRRRYR